MPLLPVNRKANEKLDRIEERLETLTQMIAALDGRNDRPQIRVSREVKENTMPDNLTPDEQNQPSSAGWWSDDWKARFDGAIRKIEQLTPDNRKLNEELAPKTSETEQLRSQLSVKDAEKLAAVGERDKRLQEVITAKTQLDGQLAELQALQLKVKVAKDMGRPDLLPILDTIPSMSDETALKSCPRNVRQLRRHEGQGPRERADGRLHPQPGWRRRRRWTLGPDHTGSVGEIHREQAAGLRRPRESDGRILGIHVPKRSIRHA